MPAVDEALLLALDHVGPADRGWEFNCLSLFGGQMRDQLQLGEGDRVNLCSCRTLRSCLRRRQNIQRARTATFEKGKY